MRRTQEETPVSDENLYTPEELAGINEWHRLEHPNLPTEPFTFYFAKLRSGSVEAEELFMDPRRALLGSVDGFPSLEGVDSETRITTTIFGHERTLRLRMILAVAAVDSTDNSVSLTSHKIL
jgi:hypothetical protein